MPIYEYRCRGCGHTTEELRALGRADDPVSCGTCDADDVVRLPSLVARRTGAGADLPMAAGTPSGDAAAAGGGCCGGGCC